MLILFKIFRQNTFLKIFSNLDTRLRILAENHEPVRNMSSSLCISGIKPYCFMIFFYYNVVDVKIEKYHFFFHVFKCLKFKICFYKHMKEFQEKARCNK